jgi:hypothetical protein
MQAGSLCDEPVQAVERALSAALTASLRVSSEDRPPFIALHLLKHTLPQAYDIDLPDPPADVASPPLDLDGELRQLTAQLKEAVNAGVRRSLHDRCSLYEGIADHLLLLDGGVGLASLNEDDGACEEAVDTTMMGAAAPGVAAPPGAQARPKATRHSSWRMGKGELMAALSKRPKKIGFHRVLLGRTPSAILPAVVGAFQESAANKAARKVDKSILQEAMAAGDRLLEEAHNARRAEEARLHADEHGLALPRGILPAHSACD